MGEVLGWSPQNLAVVPPRVWWGQEVGQPDPRFAPQGSVITPLGGFWASFTEGETESGHRASLDRAGKGLSPAPGMEPSGGRLMGTCILP